MSHPGAPAGHAPHIPAQPPAVAAHHHHAHLPTSPGNEHRPAAFPPYRLLETPDKGIEVAGWRVTCCKKQILTSEELEELQKRLDAVALPEMVFGHSFMRVVCERPQHGFKFHLTFEAEEALKEWRQAGGVAPKVAYAAEWAQGASAEIQKQGIKEGAAYDWTYTTPFKGHLSFTHSGTETTAPLPAVRVEATTEKIDLDRLRRPDPILYFDDVHLFEDELADNGTALLNVKMRVMPHSFFILLRFWLRIDNVIFRNFDTRYFHDFSTNYILRESTYRETAYAKVQAMLPDRSQHNDPNVVIPLLPLRFTDLQKIFLDPPAAEAAAVAGAPAVAQTSA